MEDRRAEFAREVEQVGVARRRGAGAVFVQDVGPHRRRCREPARELHARHRAAPVELGRQVVGLHRRAASGSADWMRTCPRDVGRSWHTLIVNPENGCGLAPARSADSVAK